MYSLLRKVTLATALPVVGSRLVGAQQVNPRSTEFGVAVGAAGMPDALSTQCGSRENGDGAAGVEVGASLLRRLGYSIALQVDTRFIAQPLMSGCYAVLPAVDTAYGASLRRDPLATSTIRLAVETPRSMPLFRLSSGYGLAWGEPTLSLHMIALAWSTRGEHKRFFVEFERLQTQVDAEERHNMPPAGQQAFRRPIVTYPVGHTLRFGLAWPRK